MKEKTRSYIAGFLDGDGSIFLQLVRRKDYIFGYQVRASIVFYQKSINVRILNWLKHKLRYGYIRNRKDGLSEYAIVGLNEVIAVIDLIEPYSILKRPQIKLAKRIIKRLQNNDIKAGFLVRIAKEVDKFSLINYSKKRKNTVKEIRQFLIQKNLLSL